MSRLEQRITDQVKQHWSYIHKVFVCGGTQMTQEQAIDCLWSMFHAKTNNLNNINELRREGFQVLTHHRQP